MAKSWTGQCLCTENRSVTINIRAQREHGIPPSQRCFLLELAFRILVYFAGGLTIFAHRAHTRPVFMMGCRQMAIA